MQRLRFLLKLTLASWLLVVARLPAQGQEPQRTPDGFPDQPLTILCPRGPGGGSHQLSTRMAAQMKALLGVDVRVVNVPGDGGMKAIERFFSAENPPNGYTILQHVDDIASSFAEGRSKVDPTRDLVPLAITQITFSQLYIRRLESRFKDWDGFLKYAREHPGELTVALVGHHGANEHLLLDQIIESFQIELTIRGFENPADRYLSLVRNEVDALIEQPGDVRPFLEKRLIRPIVTFLPERSGRFPDAVSLSELGTEMISLHRFRGFYAHGKLSTERAAFLESIMKRAFDSEAFQEFNREKHMDLMDSYRGTAGARKYLTQVIGDYRRIYGVEEKESSEDEG